MKKDIWLKPGKELNTGAIIGGIGFAIYIALSALEWRGLALFAALAFGLEAGYAFLSALGLPGKGQGLRQLQHRVGHRRVGDPDAAAGSHDHHQRVTCA